MSCFPGRRAESPIEIAACGEKAFEAEALEAGADGSTLIMGVQ